MIRGIVVALFLSGCVSTQVTRISRHERKIVSQGTYAAHSQRLRNHVVHKAKSIGCERIKYTSIKEGRVEAICVDKL